MQPRDLPSLPPDAFSEIVLDLRQYVTAYHEATQAWQVMIGRGITAPGVDDTVQATARSAGRALQISNFFNDMIPFEEEFRDFLAGLRARETAGAAVVGQKRVAR